MVQKKVYNGKQINVYINIDKLGYSKYIVMDKNDNFIKEISSIEMCRIGKFSELENNI